MNISQITPPDKLKELALHIIEMSANDPRFMSTKLNKLVWAVDYAAFCETGRTITGAPYQREKYGPVPKAMPIILKRLEKERRVRAEDVPVGTKQGVRYKALKSADLSPFSSRNLTIVAKVVAENFGKTGTDLSRETHSRLIWKISKNGDPMPFAAWFISERAPTAAEKRTGLRLEDAAKAFHARAR